MTDDTLLPRCRSADMEFTLQMCETRIKYIRSCLAKQNRDCPRTVFDTTLNPSPQKQCSITPLEHVAADAVSMIMAGSDTSSHTLVVAVFNLLHNKLDFLNHIRRELCGVIHDKDQIVQWEVLEKLPYMVQPAFTPFSKIFGS